MIHYELGDFSFNNYIKLYIFTSLPKFGVHISFVADNTSIARENVASIARENVAYINDFENNISFGVREIMVYLNNCLLNSID